MSDYNRDRAISDEYTEVIEAAREWTATPFAITKFAITNHEAALRELSAAIQHIRHLLAVVDELQDRNRRALAEERERIARYIEAAAETMCGAPTACVADAIRGMGGENENHN